MEVHTQQVQEQEQHIQMEQIMLQLLVQHQHQVHMMGQHLRVGHIQMIQ
jgi:hypothetical protein